MSYSGSSSTAQAAAMAQAVKAMGAIVKVEEPAFHKILAQSEQPLVLVAPPGGFLQKFYRYATSFRGFVFFMDSKQPVMFGRMLDIVEVKYIAIPTM